MIKILYILFGFFATSSLLAIPYTSITFFMITLVPVMVDLVFHGKRKKVKKSRMLIDYMIWAGIGIMSGIFGYVAYFLSPEMIEFRQNIISSFVKIIVYAVMLVLLLKKTDTERSSSLMRGLMFGMAFNVLFSIIDTAFIYMNGTSMLGDFFVNSKGESSSRTTNMVEGVRSAALTSDPATVAMYAVVLTSYGWMKKNYFYVFISLISSMATLSASMIVGMVLATIMHMRGKKNMIRIVIITITAVFVITIIDNPIMELMRTNMMGRMEAKTEGEDALRVAYLTKFPNAVLNTPTSLVIGSGYGTASYSYQKVIPGIRKTYAYDPEQNYLAYFIDLGLFGFLIYILMYWRLFVFFRKKSYLPYYDGQSYDYALLASLEGFCIVSLFYHFDFFSVQMLTLMLAIIRYNQLKYDAIDIKKLNLNNPVK